MEVPMGIENRLVTFEDEGPKEVSIVEKPMEKYTDGVIQDAIMSHYDATPMMMLLTPRNQPHILPHGVESSYHFWLMIIHL